MTVELSDRPLDKLHAVLNHAYPDAYDDLGPAYWTACQHWLAELTAGERWIMTMATAAYEKGDDDKAMEIVSQLPPAPVFPLP